VSTAEELASSLLGRREKERRKKKGEVRRGRWYLYS
jgi:hypothetical protein